MPDNPQPSLPSDAGFTFIELLVATVIFTLGILAMGSLQTNAMRANKTARHMTEAATLSSDRIEALMTATWTDTTIDSELTAGPHTMTTKGYTVTWTVEDGVAEKKKTITLGVTWQEGSKPHRIDQVAVRAMK